MQLIRRWGCLTENRKTQYTTERGCKGERRLFESVQRYMHLITKHACCSVDFASTVLLVRRGFAILYWLEHRLLYEVTSAQPFRWVAVGHDGLLLAFLVSRRQKPAQLTEALASTLAAFASIPNLLLLA